MGGQDDPMDVDVGRGEEEDVEMGDDEEFFDEDEDVDEDDENDEDFRVEEEDVDEEELLEKSPPGPEPQAKRHEPQRKPRLRVSLDTLRNPELVVRDTPQKNKAEEEEEEELNVVDDEGAEEQKAEEAAPETEAEKEEKAKREEEKRDESWRKYLIGELGRSRIIEALSSSDSPFRAIEEFKVENGLRTPLADVKSFYPVLELLDLHGVKRTDLYKQLVSSLLAQVLQRCTSAASASPAAAAAAVGVQGSAGGAKAPAPGAGVGAGAAAVGESGKGAGKAPAAAVLPEMTAKDRERLLKETFPYIGFEELQELPFTLLEQTPVIPKAFLRQLAANPALYATSPVKVKRQIWETEESLFVREVQPWLDQYVSSAVVNPLDLSETALLPKKRREKDPVIKQLIQWVGDSVTLYTSLVKFCSQLFLATGHTHYCTLRVELLMALHDNGTSSIYEQDPCHQVAWYLDACVGDTSIEMKERRLTEVVTLIEAVPSGSSILGDLAMILANGHAANILVATIFRHLCNAVEAEALPRDDSMLKRVTTLAALGCQAFSVLSKQQFRLPKVERDLMLNAFVFIAQLLVNDRLKQNGGECVALVPSEKFKKLFNSNSLCRQVCWRYALSRFAAGDPQSAQVVMELASDMGANINAEVAFLHSVVTLSTVGRSVSVRTKVIDNWLMKMRSELIVHMELLRFLAAHHTVLSAREFAAYLEEVCEFRTQEVAAAGLVLRVVAQVRERVGSRISELATPFFFDYLACLNDPSTVQMPVNPPPSDEQIETHPAAQDKDADNAQSEDADVDIEAEDGEILESHSSDMEVDG